ncbi:MAG: hypothetical protein WD097_03080 [Balneolales bacterium]
MNKNRGKNRPIWLRFTFLIILIAIGYLVYLYSFDRQAPVKHTESVPAASAFLYNGEPVVQLAARWHRQDHLGMDSINNRLPENYDVIILDTDITANDRSNYVIIRTDRRLPDMDRELSEAGFTHTFRNLVIYETRDRELYPVLTIDPDAILDGNGNTLISQVPAQHGYALLLEEFMHEQLYDKAIQLIEIIMLDEQGHGASDEIVIYWDPQDNAYKATNTFGAP